jgi:uncharacterized protein (DUF58 family)
MIVPRNSLIWLVAVVLLPATVAGALMSSLWPVAQLLAAGVVCAAVIDAALSIRRLDRASAAPGDTVRLTRDVEGVIPVRVTPPPGLTKLTFALSLPEGLEEIDQQQEVLLAGDGQTVRLDWPCEPERRGRYRINAVYLQTPSRLGLWLIRRSLVVDIEVRVYPNLLSERKNVAALFLEHGGVGVRAVRQVGQGREFEKLREYVPGDSYENIHWKATAKRGEPVTKVHQVERTQEVYVVIDASRLSGRLVASMSPDGTPDPDHPEPLLERYVTTSLVLGRAAERQGDLLGLMTFTDRVESFLRAAGGREHFRRCRDALYTVHPQPVAPEFNEVCSFIRTRLRRRALLVFLTHLDDPVVAENFQRNVQLIGKQHLVLAGMVRRPDETQLFTGPDVERVDDVYRHLGGHMRWGQLAELERSLRRRGVTLLAMDNEKLAPQLVSHYVNVKQRQLL